MKALVSLLPLSTPLRRSPVAYLNRLRALRKSRRDLATLPDHLIRDIGLTREAAAEEAARPFWDVPDYWLRRR
ncbi:MAG: DUF1127 domain-containing protein [Rhodobacteraceae bacterium]|nr:DUF1127 domain-containing protein [Paracoccaceae bacterium]